MGAPSTTLELAVVDVQTVARYTMPGDGIILKGAESALLNPLIRLGQTGALRDLPGRQIPLSICWELAGYTHVQMSLGEAGVIEHYRPHTRFKHWEHNVGREFIIVRPKPEFAPSVGEEQALRDAAYNANDDLELKAPYSVRELFYYGRWVAKYFGGLQKLFLHVTFDMLFKSGRGNVCSGQFWKWWIEAGFFNYLEEGNRDRRPEAWYPARYLIDDRIQLVKRVKLV